MKLRSFSRSELEDNGFQGWCRLLDIRGYADVPRTGGVYAVVRESQGEAAFQISSKAGRFKGKDPTVSSAALRANWVDSAEVIYLGKADNLRRRLCQFADFGAGKPIGHWGGRLIWQLADAEGLVIGWKETPDRIPLEVEAELITHFRSIYGKSPFANSPHLLGR